MYIVKSDKICLLTKSLPKFFFSSILLWEKSIKNYTRYLQHHTCFVRYGLFNYESEEVIFRAICDIISKVSGKYYPPRGKDVKNLITGIQSKKFKKATLGGCIIEKTYNILIFRKEFGA